MEGPNVKEKIFKMLNMAPWQREQTWARNPPLLKHQPSKTSFCLISHRQSDRLSENDGNGTESNFPFVAQNNKDSQALTLRLIAPTNST